MAPYPLDKTFLISIWLEALIYGIFVSLFCASLYVNISLRRSQDAHSKVMFYVGIIMFIIATLHVAMNCFRLIRGYIDNRLSPGGPVAYIGNLTLWDHIFKDTLYATQEILGDAVAIYRCWKLWGNNWKIIFLPSVLFICSCISGYTVCALYRTVSPTATVFSPRLTHWIATFYSIAVVQNIMTTSLMAYRIWRTDKQSAHYYRSKGSLLPVLRIFVESAFLQFFAEAVLLSLYAANYNPQYVLLESITPLIGITFNAITIRITLRSQGSLKFFGGNGSSGRSTEPHVATIGSVPMRRIDINIRKDVEDHCDDAINDAEPQYNIKPGDQLF